MNTASDASQSIQGPATSSRPATSLRDRIKSGQVVFGPFMKLASPQFVEMAGRAGFDFVVLDTEHGPLSFESVENLVRAAEVSGISPVVRVYENSGALISRALDVGAQGVLVPHVSTAEEAAAVAQASRFSPAGHRGVCCCVRAAGYSSVDRYRYFDSANRQTLVIAMIEGKKGVANLDAILSVEGLDVVFVGPYDLSQSMGVPGQVTSPVVVGEMERVVEATRSRGLAVGTYVDDAATARIWADAGVQFIACSVDVAIIYRALRASVRELAEVVRARNSQPDAGLDLHPMGSPLPRLP